MGENEMKPEHGLPCGVRLTAGLGVAVSAGNGCMPNSSGSPRGMATEALRVVTVMPIREGCGPIDRATFVLARALARALDLYSFRAARSAAALPAWDLSFELAQPVTRGVLNSKPTKDRTVSDLVAIVFTTPNELSGCEAVRLNDGLDARRVKEARPRPTSAQRVECTPRLRDGGRRRASAQMEEDSPTTETEREQRTADERANIQAKYLGATNV